jgi:hypothetical protein
MSCVVKNISGKLCDLGLISIDINSGSFNNTKIDVEVLGDIGGLAEINTGALENLILGTENVIPFLKIADWTATSCSTSKSSSGVTTQVTLQDNFSKSALETYVGLRNRVGGDIVIGNEYYSISETKMPDGTNIPGELTISRAMLMAYWNQLSSGKSYINAQGLIETNLLHYLNRNTVDNEDGGARSSYPNPWHKFGEVYYFFNELINQTPYPIQNLDPKDILGFYSDTGPFFNVMNSILNPHGKVFVANPLLGGFYVHDVNADLGKLDTLKNAGIQIPDNAISSSISEDRDSGYSSSAWIRGFSEGFLVEDSGKNSGDQGFSGDTIAIAKSDSEEATLYSQLDIQADMPSPGYDWRSLPTDRVVHDITLYTQLALNYFFESGLGKDACLAQNLNKNATFLNRNGASSDEVNHAQRILNRYSSSLSLGPNLSNYYVYTDGTKANSKISDIVSYTLDNYSETDWNKNSFMELLSKMTRYKPSQLETLVSLKNRIYYMHKFKMMDISINGDKYGFSDPGYDQTLGFMNFGTAHDVRGSRNWESTTGNELNFFGWYSDLSTTPFKELYQQGGSSTFDRLHELKVWPPGISPEETEGAILMDKGPMNYTGHEDDFKILEREYSDLLDVLIDAEQVSFLNNETFNSGVAIVPKKNLTNGAHRDAFWQFYIELKSLYEKHFKMLSHPTPSGLNSTVEFGYYGEANVSLKPINSLTSMQGTTNNGRLPKGFTNNFSNSTFTPSINRKETFSSNAQEPVKHPNRNINNYSYKSSSIRYNPYGGNSAYFPPAFMTVIDPNGKVNLSAWKSDKYIYVDSLSRMNFSLINEMIDFDANPDWKKYIESMSVSITDGILTANYTFSQKIMLPDYLSLAQSKADVQNMIKGIRY